MAKVKQETVEAAIVLLMQKITATMPSSACKFIFGGATGLVGVSKYSKIKEALAKVAEPDGLLDTCKLRKIYESAFNASGGKL